MNYQESLLTPALFAQKASNYRWFPAEHLLMLSDYLVTLAAGVIKRLMVFMPPRHGKSELVSKYFPAWYLGKRPDNRIILTSYEADFASSWGWRAKNLLNEFGPDYFGIEVNPESSARNRWDILRHDGGMITAGVGGPITGKGAHILIIDDPVKNAEGANSKVYRDKTYEWFKSTAYTRLEPGGAVVLIMTRWHEDDLAGRLLEEMKGGGEKWEVISLPAIAEEHDVLGRQPGEALWQERFSIDKLEKIRQAIGSYWWSALYKQKPTDATGGLFRRAYFRYFKQAGDIYELITSTGTKYVPVNSCMIFQTCDPAGSEKESADYFVLGTWAKTQDNELLLLDIIRMKLETPDQPNLFMQAYHRWHPSYQGVETKAIGLALFHMLLRMGLPVRQLEADTDKVIRARPAAARMEAGTVYFLEGAQWLRELEEELLAFPRGVHDDQVDVLAYAARAITVTDEFHLIGGLGDTEL